MFTLTICSRRRKARGFKATVEHPRVVIIITIITMIITLIMIMIIIIIIPITITIVVTLIIPCLHLSVPCKSSKLPESRPRYPDRPLRSRRGQSYLARVELCSDFPQESIRRSTQTRQTTTNTTYIQHQQRTTNINQHNKINGKPHKHTNILGTP